MYDNIYMLSSVQLSLHDRTRTFQYLWRYNILLYEYNRIRSLNVYLGNDVLEIMNKK